MVKRLAFLLLLLLPAAASGATATVGWEQSTIICTVGDTFSVWLDLNFSDPTNIEVNGFSFGMAWDDAAIKVVGAGLSPSWTCAPAPVIFTVFAPVNPPPIQVVSGDPGLGASEGCHGRFAFVRFIALTAGLHTVKNGGHSYLLDEYGEGITAITWPTLKVMAFALD